MTEYLSYLLWLLLLVPAFYLLIPLLIRFQQKFPAEPRLEPLQLQRLKPKRANFLMEQTKALLALGFDEPAMFQMPDPVPNVTGYIIMVVNRQAGDKAMVTVLVGQGGGVTIQTLYVEFSTRFVSGEVFDTLNSSELSAFPPGPLTIRTQTPSVKEPHELYELHKHVMRTNPVRAKKMMYEPGQAEEYLIQYAFIKSYDEQVARGWLYFDESCACYRPTMKGAYLMTWGLVQPFKAIRMSRLKRQERAVLAEFERERTG